jgi:hypothetical protein
MPNDTRIGFRPDKALADKIAICVDHSDITTSRFLQRAAENELERRARIDPKLKQKLRKVK